MKKNYLKPATEEVRLGMVRLLNASGEDSGEEEGCYDGECAKQRSNDMEEADYGETNRLW